MRSSLLSKIKSFLAVCALSIPCLFEFNRSRLRHTYLGGYDTPLHARIPPHSQFSKGCACVRTTVRSVKPRSMYCLLSACPCPSSAAPSSLRPRAHNGATLCFPTTQDDDLFVDDVGGTTTAVQGAGGGARAGLSGRNGGSARVSGGAGAGGVGELAALVANTNPGYHDYMSQVTPRRRGSEAFG